MLAGPALHVRRDGVGYLLQRPSRMAGVKHLGEGLGEDAACFVIITCLTGAAAHDQHERSAARQVGLLASWLDGWGGAEWGLLRRITAAGIHEEDDKGSA